MDAMERAKTLLEAAANTRLPAAESLLVARAQVHTLLAIAETLSAIREGLRYMENNK